MITIIVCIFIVIFLLIIFKYFSGRNKSRHEKSGLEKAATTLVNKDSTDSFSINEDKIEEEIKQIIKD